MMGSTNKLVWYPEPTHGYCLGRIVDIKQSLITLQRVASPSNKSLTLELINKNELVNSSYSSTNNNNNNINKNNIYQQQQQLQNTSNTSPFNSYDSSSQQEQFLEFPYKSVYPCDQYPSLESLLEPTSYVDVEDNCALIQLNEAALLENVRVRFQKDKIYTYVAHILIAVNPYFEIHNLHSPEAIIRYQGKSLGTLEPHVFALADKAYRDMKAFRQSQSIIINGESGAGKTESQKYVLRYLCLSGSQSGRLEKLILDANPILEAFGNAKTIRNNNSSRFGKFIEIHYTNKFTVSGGLFLHYLLEKSRICTQSQGERNYHIFYQLCACLPQELWTKLSLGAPDKFRYLAGGCTQYFCARDSDLNILTNERKSDFHKKAGSIQDQLIDDLKCYEQTDRALTNFGVSGEQKELIYTIVAAVLHLGNITFCEDDDDDDNNDDKQKQTSKQNNNSNNSNTRQNSSSSQNNRSGGCKLSPSSEVALETTCRLMGLDKDLLRQSLTTRIMSTSRGGHKGTIYMVSLSLAQAQAARDALAKAIYSKLFDYIVCKIVNATIPSISQSAYYIGVLDVAGFEYFQHNSFEQFLINFCNEKLQQFFNQRILKEEQNIYEKEGLNLERVEFTDNQDCIQLFESKATGIFDLLDEESRLPKSNAQHFTQSVHSANKGHFRLALPRTSKLRSHREIRDDEGFIIRHFAGAVCYETSSFIDKNNDALHASLRNLMLEAEQPLLRELFSNDQKDLQQQQKSPNVLINQQSTTTTTTSNKLNFISVGSTFRNQLNELMGKLRSTGSHFIRCIKPNSEMVAHKFEGGQILSQLHCSGMDSVLRLMQQGYPSRSSFLDINAKYKSLLPNQLARLDAHLFCRALFKALGLSDSDFRFGVSKVFFRPGKFAEFDQIIRSDGDHVAQLVERVSRWLVRSRWRKVQYASLCAVKLTRKIQFRRELILCLQRNWRLAIVHKHTKFRLNAVKSARNIESSLNEFEKIGAKELRKLAPDKSKQLSEESELLRHELNQFITKLRNELQQIIEPRAISLVAGDRQVAGRECLVELERLQTKRDLLVRSIKDKLQEQKELAALEERVREERKKREQEETAKLREEQIKLQRIELEKRRQIENANSANLNFSENSSGSSTMKRKHSKQIKEITQTKDDENQSNIENQQQEQEQRDYEIAMRLSQDQSINGDDRNGGQNNARRLVPLAPSENLSDRLCEGNINDLKYDLSSWKYSDLRDTINTSCDLELLEACKREFHRRLRVYHAWRAANSTRNSIGSQVANGETQALSNGLATDSTTGFMIAGSRAPISIMMGANDTTITDNSTATTINAISNEQRYFRIPFVKASTSSSGQRGWWFAHFDGQWICRQLELHPNREPILLIAGQHDIDMCELSLAETRLTSKRGAEILAHEFEAEWTKHGGKMHSKNTKQSK